MEYSLFALQRELERATGDLDVPARALQATQDGVAFWALSPPSCRKVGASAFVRELVISFGASG